MGPAAVAGPKPKPRPWPNIQNHKYQPRWHEINPFQDLIGPHICDTVDSLVKYFYFCKPVHTLSFKLSRAKPYSIVSRDCFLNNELTN